MTLTKENTSTGAMFVSCYSNAKVDDESMSRYLEHGDIVASVDPEDILDFIAGDDSLMHWKYIKRERDGKGWKYFYPEDFADKVKSKIEETTGRIRSKAEDIVTGRKAKEEETSSNDSEEPNIPESTKKSTGDLLRDTLKKVAGSTMSDIAKNNLTAKDVDISDFLSGDTREYTKGEQAIIQAYADYYDTVRGDPTAVESAVLDVQNHKALMKMLFGGAMIALTAVGALAAIWTLGASLITTPAYAGLLALGATIGESVGTKMFSKGWAERSTLAAMKKKLEAQYKERSKEKTDPKTGFLLKNKETSPEDDVVKTNQHCLNAYKDGTMNNCVLCTATFEMRRRGYDVVANDVVVGYTITDDNKWFPNAKLMQTTGGKKELEKYLQSQGVGARGDLRLQWKAKFGGSAHSVAYEVTKNGIILYDAQTGNIYKQSSAEYNALLSCAEDNYSSARYDNVDFNIEELRKIMR